MGIKKEFHEHIQSIGDRKSAILNNMQQRFGKKRWLSCDLP